MGAITEFLGTLVNQLLKMGRNWKALWPEQMAVQTRTPRPPPWTQTAARNSDSAVATTQNTAATVTRISAPLPLLLGITRAQFEVQGRSVCLAESTPSAGASPAGELGKQAFLASVGGGRLHCSPRCKGWGTL